MADERTCLVKLHDPEQRCPAEPILLVYIRCSCGTTHQAWHHGRGLVCREHLVDLMNGVATHNDAVIEMVHSEPIEPMSNEEST